MRRYGADKKIELLLCNCCGKKINIADISFEDYTVNVKKSWGYKSEKDGYVYSFDLCEECYDKITAGFKVPVDIRDLTEYL